MKEIAIPEPLPGERLVVLGTERVCQTCQGHGTYLIGFMRQKKLQPCPMCQGAGKVTGYRLLRQEEVQRGFDGKSEWSVWRDIEGQT